MKVVVKLIVPESYDKFIYLDEKEMAVEENNDRLVIETSYRDRINSLISLFALKKDWECKEGVTSLYNVMFENKGETQVYCFDEMPVNWNMFMGYLYRLVGDSI